MFPRDHRVYEHLHHTRRLSLGWKVVPQTICVPIDSRETPLHCFKILFTLTRRRRRRRLAAEVEQTSSIARRTHGNEFASPPAYRCDHASGEEISLLPPDISLRRFYNCSSPLHELASLPKDHEGPLYFLTDLLITFPTGLECRILYLGRGDQIQTPQLPHMPRFPSMILHTLARLAFSAMSEMIPETVQHTL